MIRGWFAWKSLEIVCYHRPTGFNVLSVLFITIDFFECMSWTAQTLRDSGITFSALVSKCPGRTLRGSGRAFLALEVFRMNSTRLGRTFSRTWRFQDELYEIQEELSQHLKCSGWTLRDSGRTFSVLEVSRIRRKRQKRQKQAKWERVARQTEKKVGDSTSSPTLNHWSRMKNFLSTWSI